MVFHQEEDYTAFLDAMPRLRSGRFPVLTASRPWLSLGRSGRLARRNPGTLRPKDDRLELVNGPRIEADEEPIRFSITRDRPFGPAPGD